MAGSNDEEMESSILQSFDEIYQDFKDRITEIQSLKSTCDAETKRREALEISCANLKSENERLVKNYSESLSKIADQIERRLMCKRLVEELKKVKEEGLSKEEEHKKAVELLKQEHVTEIEDFKKQVRCLLLQQAAKEETVNNLHNDLAAHRTHIDALNRKLEQVQVDIQSRHNQEIQDLKDWLLVEQEEKNELHKKLHNAEMELVDSKRKLMEQQRDSTLNRHVETLKQRILNLRKGNEVLKRQVHDFKEGQ